MFRETDTVLAFGGTPDSKTIHAIYESKEDGSIKTRELHKQPSTSHHGD
jgi:hypothetical protein